MKKGLKILLLSIIISLLVLPTVSAQTKSFKDVSSSHWAKKEIEYLVGKHIINGYTNGNFGVNDPVTRAQAALMVVRSYGWEGEWENPNYPDVKTNHYAYNAIAHLYNMDIFKPSGNFYPDKALTRAEMAQILVNAFQLSSIKASAYTDVNPSNPYYDAINILSGNQITSGYPDGTYRPNAPVTRTEFAVFMTRALDESSRLTEKKYADVEGVIYDLQVANQYYRLENPMLLFDVWMAPLELFEKMGYVIQEVGDDYVSLESIKHGSLQLKTGETKIWIDETSVELNEPLMKYNGMFYIDSHPILEALQTPLVFYPNEFLIALETPQVTAAQIMSNSPSTALDVVHTKQPYWHWTKRDKDYLELISMNKQIESKKTTLLDEMKTLTSAYVKIENEVETINGINYISDHVSGKLDAVSRAIEARYNLLTDKQFDYPVIGKSGGLGVIGQLSSYSYDYLVYDHVYEHLDENKRALTAALSGKNIIDLNVFKGLNVFAIPFNIVQNKGTSDAKAWAGLAYGSENMFVINSSVGTFYHELGHNWDAMLGNHETYLRLRNKSSYQANSNEWADRVSENFAEDFTIAIMPEAHLDHHRGVFGNPTEQEMKNIQTWILEESKNYPKEVYELTLNNLAIVPDVIAVNEGQLLLKGTVNDSVRGELTSVSHNENSEMQFSADEISKGVNLSLPNKGVYKLVAGSISTIVVFE